MAVRVRRRPGCGDAGRRAAAPAEHRGCARATDADERRAYQPVGDANRTHGCMCTCVGASLPHLSHSRPSASHRPGA